MRKVSQYILAVLFFALVLEIALMEPNDVADKTPSSHVAEHHKSRLDIKSSDVQQQMAGVHVVETNNESKEWELWAKRAIGFKAESELALQHVKASFFAKNGLTFLVKGQTGSIVTATKNMIVNGGVVTTSSNGYIFHTDTVRYNSKERVLSSPTHVVVDGPRDAFGKHMYIQGQSMKANLRQGTVTISNHVRAQKEIRKNEDMIVRADRAKLFGKGHEVKFSGQVNIDINGIRITGPDALFHYKNGTDIPDSVQLTGGVKVHDVDKWATSERLRINLAKDEFVFDGQPRVVQDNDEISGNQIVFLDGGKKVQVKNARVHVSNKTLKSHKMHNVVE